MFFMLTLVLAKNYLLMFIGWEGVGLASYLLIGFWFTKDSAASAGKKAFITNRIGDFGFLIALFLLIKHFGSLDYTQVFESVSKLPAETTGIGLLTSIGLLLMVGASVALGFPLGIFGGFLEGFSLRDSAAFDDWQAAKALTVGDDDFASLYAWWEFPEAWRAIEASALREWTAAYPGTRPASWWYWSAPELRRVTGAFRPIAGRERCYTAGVPYLEPQDPKDQPIVESTPHYLDRLGLWLPRERMRINAAAFDDQPFSLGLCWFRPGAPTEEE
jgi:hypothetical protein